jgi:bifunctional UDP-N-acetylglucosamine pyrophosphorylase/glucosamine-1-phosphate N-acetyltransferase
MTKIKIINIGDKKTLEPLTIGRRISDNKIAGCRYADILKNRLELVSSASLCVREDFFPSDAMLAKIAKAKIFAVFCPQEGLPVCWSSHGDSDNPSSDAERFECDKESRIIRYPWDFLFINESIISKLEKSEILCEIRNGVNIEGKVKIAKSAQLLPGVFIEGNAIIGENCKIGPNCYIRGNSYIGDGCHIGQAVEIKNSVLMEKVSVGHLSYIGDSIIGINTNLGAGTITANLRHDGENHRSQINDELVNTGRKKFGAVIGDNVHTGIHTSIYPGRKIWPNMTTAPGEIVRKDIKNI